MKKIWIVIIIALLFFTGCQKIEFESIKDTETDKCTGNTYIILGKETIIYSLGSLSDFNNRGLFIENIENGERSKIRPFPIDQIQSDNDNIYLLITDSADAGRSLYSLNKDGSTKKLLKNNVYQYIVNNNIVYYELERELFKSDIDGSNRKKLLGHQRLCSFGIYNNSLYYTTYDGKLGRIDLNTNQCKILTKDFNNYNYSDIIKIEDDNVFVVASSYGGPHDLVKYSIKENNKDIIINNIEDAKVVNNNIYYIIDNNDQYEIYMRNMGDNSISCLYSTTDLILDFVVDDNNIYVITGSKLDDKLIHIDIQNDK